MSFVVAEAEMVQAAAGTLAGVRSTLGEAAVAAAAPTTGVVAAAADEVSASVAALFGAYGQEYQALSAHAQAFHAQFVNLLNAGAGAYLSTEAANAAQAVASAVNGPVRGLLADGVAARVAAASSALTASGNDIVGPYQSLFTNTVANLRGLSTTWANVTQPALLQAIATQTNPQPFLTALTTGNLQPLLATTGQFARGSANLMANLALPATLSVTSYSPSNISLNVGLGLPSLLAFDALGAPVNAALAMASSSTAILQAMQTGNPLTVFTAMVDAPANVTNAFLNGEATVPLPLPVPGLSAVMADVPFRGLLVPVQPFTTTATLPGSPLPSVTITGPPVGGLLPALLGYTPQLLAGAFS